MNKNTIFIIEFVSGGGFNQVEIPASLFAEGFGMLRSIIADFKNLDYEIETLLDFRIHFLSRYLNADFINIIQNSDNFCAKFKECIKKSKFCFIIAPEFLNILFNLTKIALDNDRIVLSVGLKGIILGSSKLKTYNFLKEKKICTPITFLVPYKQGRFDIEFIIRKLNEFDAPIIIKPEDGVGAESIYYFENESQIIKFFNQSTDLFDYSRRYILQEFIEGVDLSVSVIGNNNPNKLSKSSPIIIGINHQHIVIKDSHHESKYLGGYTPVENWEDIALSLKKNFEKLNFSYFNGYFGIDFIQKQEKLLSFVEINPRLTTSYIGIRNVVRQNLMEIILNFDENDFDLYKNKFRKFSKFGPLNLEYTGIDSFENVSKIIIPKMINDLPEIVTPPIKLNSDDKTQKDYYICFIATKTKDLPSSERRINKIKKVLKKNEFNIIK
ncbi:MAG: ATP-grasp domain-containing protein [Promethearchaeota archaeon]